MFWHSRSDMRWNVMSNNQWGSYECVIDGRGDEEHLLTCYNYVGFNFDLNVLLHFYICPFFFFCFYFNIDISACVCGGTLTQFLPFSLFCYVNPSRCVCLLVVRWLVFCLIGQIRFWSLFWIRLCGFLCGFVVLNQSNWIIFLRLLEEPQNGSSWTRWVTYVY